MNSTIDPYARGLLDWGGETPPYGYLPCDGRPLPNSGQYAALFVAIGSLYGIGLDDAGAKVTGCDFNLPDRRGVFPRGVDANGLRDSDFANRTALHGGTASGGRVGSYQPDDFKSHHHDVNDPPHSHTSDAQVDVAEGFAGGGNTGNGHEEPNGNTKATIQPNVTGITIRDTGGNETRAKNVYVNYIIKYK